MPRLLPILDKLEPKESIASRASFIFFSTSDSICIFIGFKPNYYSYSFIAAISVSACDLSIIPSSLYFTIESTLV
jgi:hypothetical protein